MAYLPGLTAMLTPGARFRDEDREYVIASEPAGEVRLPSGRVAACDPLTDAGSEPFTVAVAPGSYPLRAWVAVVHRGGTETDRRTAALELVVGGRPAARWEPALLDGQRLDQLSEDGFFGYPVDAGVGTLADPVALRALSEWDYDRLEDVFIPDDVAPAPSAINAITDEPTGANVVIVSSGWGDGCYPTFVGYDADGRVTSFVTDFLVVSGI